MDDFDRAQMNELLRETRITNELLDRILQQFLRIIKPEFHVGDIIDAEFVRVPDPAPEIEL